ncbi:MAG: aconitate hydratase AcnA [Rhodospirillales bacterium]
MTAIGKDTLKTRRTLKVGGKSYDYYSIKAAGEALGEDFSRLPRSMKVVLENFLRREDGRTVTVDDIKSVAQWLKDKKCPRDIAFHPARVMTHDVGGFPAILDMAAMREAMVRLGGDAKKINPILPVDLIIDHSVGIDFYGTPDAFEKNVNLEMERNVERYAFAKWGAQAFDNLRIIPPGTGICHQINLEYLAKTVWTSKDPNGKLVAYPDTLVATDSHTPMVNALAVLGWGVGGIEAESVMLGQPISMLLPEVVGMKLTGSLKEGMTATDMVLNAVRMLREKGVVAKFVEFYGPGLASLAIADRATLANMSPEYGATCGFSPVDEATLRYMRLTGRDEDQVALVEAYAKEQGLWRHDDDPDPVFTDTLELDLGSIEPSLAGPKRPQDTVKLSQAKPSFAKALTGFVDDKAKPAPFDADGKNHKLGHGDVVLAAITSCTNTSNPSVMIAAGLLAKKAHAKGLTKKPWVKTSLAPGSQVVADYFEAADLQKELDALGFNLAGFGCTSCLGNSGPLDEPVAEAIEKDKLVACAVLSGNRNFEGRVHPLCRANYLASPPLVVAFAIAGTMNIDMFNDPLGKDKDGNDVYLKDIWPSNEEIQQVIESVITPDMFRKRYADVEKGPKQWQALKSPTGPTYDWDDTSTYLQNPPFFDGTEAKPAPLKDIHGARVLLLLGDSVTTDHISPIGAISKNTPAADFLIERQVRPQDFNIYGARRCSHDIMTRGTFANIRIRNLMVPDTEGGVTKHLPDGEVMSVFEAAMKYQAEGVPLVVVGGKEYGTGSSRDWAAKGTRLLGARAVIAESYERIHRSNLIGMGVIPLQFKDGMTRETLKLDGTEVFDITGIEGKLKPQMDIPCTITRADGSKETITVLSRIDTLDEVEYFVNGGILQYVLRQMMAA